MSAAPHFSTSFASSTRRPAISCGTWMAPPSIFAWSMPYFAALPCVMPICANTGMPAFTMARSASGNAAASSIFTMSAPPSSTRRLAPSRRACVPCAPRPVGRSQLTSERVVPRRTALQTSTISSSVMSSGSVRPHRFMPTESPTETRSTPARSAMRAICVSHATTPTILRASRFIAWRPAIVTFPTSTRGCPPCCRRSRPERSCSTAPSSCTRRRSARACTPRAARAAGATTGSRAPRCARPSRRRST